MQRVAFTKAVDEPRLEHARKEIMGAAVWDKYLERGRLEWSWIGDEDVPFEKALTDPKEITNISEKMVNEGRFVFTYKGLRDPIRVRVAIEKYELRRRFFLGVLYGYRGSISLPDNNEKFGYLVSRNLSDLCTKLFSFCIMQKETKFLEEKDATVIMSGW
jgi:hypothetical protein